MMIGDIKIIEIIDVNNDAADLLQMVRETINNQKTRRIDAGLKNL
jgi:cell fate (sporulation/competence/biofilm development) regulator YmcA (YheA/YmcA/DUF963 family)